MDAPFIDYFLIAPLFIFVFFETQTSGVVENENKSEAQLLQVLGYSREDTYKRLEKWPMQINS